MIKNIAVCLAVGMTVISTCAMAQEVTNVAPAMSVESTIPQVSSIPDVIVAHGRFQPWQEMTVSPEISGVKIEDVFFDVGDRVRKGDVLARLSDETLQSRIIQEEAALLTAEVNFEQAKLVADRARALQARASGAISDQKASDDIAAERRAEAQLASARASLANLQRDLANTDVLAPDDGLISSRSVTIGGMVNAGAEMFRIFRQGRIEWQAEVPVRMIGAVSIGDTVTISSDHGPLTGKVRMIAPRASETTGRVTVHVEMDEAAALLAGVSVSGEIRTGESEAILVPNTAISYRDGFSYVFVIEDGPSGTIASRKKVEMGRTVGDRVEILAGISPSDRIVAAGGAFLSEGTAVSVTGEVK